MAGMACSTSGDPDAKSGSGFWNSLPIEEERIPLPPMPPHYAKKGSSLELRPLAWINVRELTLFLGLTHSAAACARLAIALLDWPL
jgi:hypothetical protein